MMEFSSQFDDVSYSFSPAHGDRKEHSLHAMSGGKSVGHMDWNPGNGIIGSAAVHPDYQRRGIASDMARQVSSQMPVLPSGRRMSLSHSTDRTPEGDRFAAATKEYTYVPRNQNAPRKRTRAKYQAEDF